MNVSVSPGRSSRARGPVMLEGLYEGPDETRFAIDMTGGNLLTGFGE